MVKWEASWARGHQFLGKITVPVCSLISIVRVLIVLRQVTVFRVNRKNVPAPEPGLSKHSLKVVLIAKIVIETQKHSKTDAQASS